MLLAAIDEHCQGTYDFIYLPIDFKASNLIGWSTVFQPWHTDSCLDMVHVLVVECVTNSKIYKYYLQNKCNVGYAFINMIDPQQIIPFYKVWYMDDMSL